MRRFLETSLPCGSFSPLYFCIFPTGLLCPWANELSAHLRPKPLIQLGPYLLSRPLIFPEVVLSDVPRGTALFPLKVEDYHVGTEKGPSQSSPISHLIKVSFPRRTGCASKQPITAPLFVLEAPCPMRFLFLWALPLPREGHPIFQDPLAQEY